MHLVVCLIVSNESGVISRTESCGAAAAPAGRASVTSAIDAGTVSGVRCAVEYGNRHDTT